MKSQTFSQNKEQQLSKNAFEAPYGSQFVGWSTEPNAFSDEIEYTDNQSITVKENMTLYAIWKMLEGRGTNIETKNFQFVFDDWQTTDASVKPGDDFYEYSAGQFYELDEEEQSKKSLSSKLDLQMSNFNSAQLNEPSFKIGQKYKELVIKDDDEFETVLDFLQEDIDKIKEVSTVSEFYELFAEYMWNDESYAYFTANFNGREPCVIIHIPGKEKITELTTVFLKKNLQIFLYLSKNFCRYLFKTTKRLHGTQRNTLEIWNSGGCGSRSRRTKNVRTAQL